MTKEELEKEAIAKYKTGSYPQLHPDVRAFVHGFLAAAEPREKQIEIDAEQIRNLQKQNGELTDKVKKLEAQIEKMKNCKNCANYMISGKCPSFFRTGWCKNWKMTK